MTDSAPASVEVRGLEKRYGETVALGGVSFDVAPGELFGLIGPDGAGKSTLLRILVTVILPDAGGATLDGLDVVADYREIRRRVGYMPGRFSLYPDLTVRENLEFFASVFGTTVEAEIGLIAPIYSQIQPFDDRRAGDLSGGMKQKLALCCALVHRPRVLLLDEPTTGVDAVSRVEFWDMLDAMTAQGITTIVSTPYMDEAARCGRIALVQTGQLLGPPDTPAAVAASFGAPLARARADGDRAAFLAALRASDGVASAAVFGEWVHVTGTADRSAAPLSADLVRSLAEAGWVGVAAEPATATVEDVFMARMGEGGERGTGNGERAEKDAVSAPGR
ncbi:ABC transporter ATP-binding protein [Rubrivirga sp. IMCC43871]|uniref:ABC transporter ATP-binding protein n=1 Tax=Rubrivirga sp. IMCC43871 TaxID=3391575 RepID=UPI00398F950D